MIKRICVLLLLAASANAELRFTRAAVTSTSQTITIQAGEVLLINDDDDDSVYVRIFSQGETAAPATTAHFEIKPHEGFGFPRSLSVSAVSLVTASGSAEVRLAYW